MTDVFLQAGLNLNIFGALSGAFSSKSNKTTETDGSSVENREENASVSGEWLRTSPVVLSRGSN